MVMVGSSNLTVSGLYRILKHLSIDSDESEGDNSNT